MATYHILDSRKMSTMIAPESIDLTITSPPYPMIKMWDDLFVENCDLIPVKDWTVKNAMQIFESMHAYLDSIWTEIFKVSKEGSIVAINIGDATRSIDGRFHLFPNAARITIGMIKIGFTPLPNIYWKKSTNKPNAFLGSGFYPVNAYVTVDCEHILLFRKGMKRNFKKDDLNREESKFTKAERNLWFSQIWTIPGAKQRMVNGRKSAEYPEEIPLRLIKMFSIIGDTVLDPFCGTGTTVATAVKLERKGVGIDINKDCIMIAKSDDIN